nr:tail protein [Gammaproteobacteria bacterium]
MVYAMSWKDGFTARGSFRGAEFWVREAKFEGGRRVQSVEYPLRDIPFNEDLGRKARKYTFEAYCIGPDYHLERDALRAEIEKPGPGTLKHPYLGNINVVVLDFSVRESTREGGFAAITIKCVEEGQRAFPAPRPSTQYKVQEAATNVLDVGVVDFSRVFVLGDASDAAGNFLSNIDDIFSGVTNVIGDVPVSLSDLFSQPLDLGAAISGLVIGVNNLVPSPLGALDVLRKLFSAGTRPVVSNSSPRALQTVRNRHALNVLVRTSAVAASAQAAAALELSPARQSGTPITRDRVLSIRDDLLAEIDAIQETTHPIDGDPIDDDVYNNLAALRLVVTEDLSTRAGRLPAVRNYTPRASLPALVLAHQLYGDASREAELVALNNIPHPGHVTGGYPLEVLSE